MKRFWQSKLLLGQFLIGHGFSGFELEYCFHPTRRWRFDVAFPERKIALEIEGITKGGGRHQRIVGFEDDIEKYLNAQALGWRIVRVTPKRLSACTLWVDALKAQEVRG